MVFFLTLRDGLWTLYIHPRHTNHGFKHIHIERNELGGEYSWNIDGTRHDKHKFPPNEKWINAAKEIAAKHLNVRYDTLRFLTSVRIAPQYVLVMVSSGEQLLQFTAVRKQNIQLVILSSQDDRIHFMAIDKNNVETQG